MTPNIQQTARSYSTQQGHCQLKTLRFDQCMVDGQAAVSKGPKLRSRGTFSIEGGLTSSYEFTVYQCDHACIYTFGTFTCTE